MTAGLTVLKFGGELLETDERRGAMATAIRRVSQSSALVVVHGGGREIDADMAVHGIDKHAVDGLRITDARTLEIVVGVLAGRVNTRRVATLGSMGVRAVGLTAADGDVASVRMAAPYTAADGATVDLGFVGQPSGDGSQLIETLCASGFVPVVASVGANNDGQLLNVNADTLAGHLAASLGADRLLIAGGTPGVLDPDGATIPVVDGALMDQLIGDGRASAGMVAKLAACRAAARSGVARVDIVTGKQTADLDASPGTRIEIPSMDGSESTES